jgi:hypothetical protein
MHFVKIIRFFISEVSTDFLERVRLIIELKTHSLRQSLFNPINIFTVYLPKVYVNINVHGCFTKNCPIRIVCKFCVSSVQATCLSALQDFAILTVLEGLCKSQSSFLFNIPVPFLILLWYKNRNKKCDCVGENYLLFFSGHIRTTKMQCNFLVPRDLTRTVG